MKIKLSLAVVLALTAVLFLTTHAYSKENEPLECPTVYLEKDAKVGCPGFKQNLAKDDSIYKTCAEGGTCGDPNEIPPEDLSLPEDYRGIHYFLSMGGSYFAKKKGLDVKGMIGVRSGVDFRLMKLMSFGFDTCYGWLSGSGNQYLSAFNPGIKIYPMMYKNPSFEPFITVGGNAFDSIFGSTEYKRIGMAQGGFAGAGAHLKYESVMIGFEFMVRASFLYMQRPNFTGGRTLAIPIYGFIGVFY